MEYPGSLFSKVHNDVKADIVEHMAEEQRRSEPIELHATVNREIVSREGLTAGTESDVEAHMDVFSTEEKMDLASKFRAMYPQYANMLEQARATGLAVQMEKQLPKSDS